MGSREFDVWPKVNEKYILDKTFELVIQVNGKKRASKIVEYGTSEESSTAFAKELLPQINFEDVKKIIFIENKLINFVI